MLIGNYSTFIAETNQKVPNVVQETAESIPYVNWMFLQNGTQNPEPEQKTENIPTTDRMGPKLETARKLGTIR